MATDGVSGAGQLVVRMALLEQQQQSVQEVRGARSAWHELGMAAQKVANVHEVIAESTKAHERIIESISAAMSAWSLTKSVAGVGVPEGDRDAAAEPPRHQVGEGVEHPAAEPQVDLRHELKTFAAETADVVLSVARQGLEGQSENNRQSSESYEAASDALFDLTAKLRGEIAREVELTSEMFKVGSILKKVG